MRHVFIVLATLSFCFPSHAASDAESECATAGDGTGLAVGYCIADLLKKEDERLNRAYNSLLNSLKNMDEPFKGKDGKGFAEGSLREAQRTWLKYRNTNCGYYFSLAQGGTAGSLNSVICQWRMTKGRADELEKEALFWAGKGY